MATTIDSLDLRAGVDYLHAVETVAIGLANAGPTAEQASYEFEDEIDRALCVLYGDWELGQWGSR